MGINSDSEGMPCPNPQCSFVLNPDAKQAIEGGSGYFTCPQCHETHDLLSDLPWHGPEDPDRGTSYVPGGGTRIGIPMSDQGQIGENLVEQMGTLPGYGPITWWHPGGANTHSPLDGATKEWGIEVKTIGYDALHHRFIPGRTFEKEAKNEQAQQMGLKGILGILVILDYRRDVADIYAKEMPLGAWTNSIGRQITGVAAFRTNSAQKLVAEVPFENPYKDPDSPTPASYSLADYYRQPQPLDFQPPTNSAMPF